MKKLMLALAAGLLSFAFSGAYAGEADMKKDSKAAASSKGGSAASSSSMGAGSGTTTTTTTTTTDAPKGKRAARATKG
jgi:hypothetical protein